MRWQDKQGSSNIEDRRGQPARGKAGAVGGGAVLIVALLAAIFRKDLGPLIQVLGGGAAQQPASATTPTGVPANDEVARFVSVVLADTEQTWSGLLPQSGRAYALPVLVLFTDEVQSACGLTSSAVGPFYCPGDNKVYIDLTFFHELDRRFGAPGDFAQAYVIAHEVGHHVQNLLGIDRRTRMQSRGQPEAVSNALSVRQELQADCFAGVWAHHAHTQRQLLDNGDVEEGLRAAAAIGDDTLARAAGRRARPESFTHGTAAQRVRWFRQGFSSGAVASCDTFAAQDL